jgi:hypothetical protein
MEKTSPTDGIIVNVGLAIMFSPSASTFVAVSIFRWNLRIDMQVADDEQTFLDDASFFSIGTRRTAD